MDCECLIDYSNLGIFVLYLFAQVITVLCICCCVHHKISAPQQLIETRHGELYKNNVASEKIPLLSSELQQDGSEQS